MLRYCAQLELHNERSWFHENHKWYEEAKRDFLELTELLKFRVAETAGPALAERLLYADAKDMLYRIPRDMRIRSDRPPYTPSWRAYISGDKHALWPVGYYYRIQPGDRSIFGTGGWCPDQDWLRKVRGFIAENHERFSAALAESGLPLEGDKLKRVPSGFDPLSPAAAFVKYKSWLVSEPFSDAELTDFDRFADRVAQTVLRLEPLRQFFDDAFAEKPKTVWDPMF